MIKTLFQALQAVPGWASKILSHAFSDWFWATIIFVTLIGLAIVRLKIRMRSPLRVLAGTIQADNKSLPVFHLAVDGGTWKAERDFKHGAFAFYDVPLGSVRLTFTWGASSIEAVMMIDRNVSHLDCGIPVKPQNMNVTRGANSARDRIISIVMDSLSIDGSGIPAPNLAGARVVYNCTARVVASQPVPSVPGGPFSFALTNVSGAPDPSYAAVLTSDSTSPEIWSLDISLDHYSSIKAKTKCEH